jgi:serine protease inhibitor
VNEKKLRGIHGGRIMRIMSILGCLFSFCLWGQQQNSQAPLSTLSESEIAYFQKLVEGNNRFAFDLYQQVKQQPGNFYFSPYSIVSGLGMLAIGAKGETANQLERTFHYSSALLLFIGDLNASLQKSSKNGKQVFLANALWLDKSLPVLPSFKQTLLSNFRTTVQSTDFAEHLSQSIQQINQWVEKQTNNKIYNMVVPQDVTTKSRLLLTTGAYLRGAWGNSFNPTLTKRLPFQITPQRTMSTEMMQMTANYPLWKGEQGDLLVVPFAQESEGAQLAMAILVPKKELSLNELEKDFTWENWQQWKGKLQNQEVTLTLPRFHIEKGLDLESLLKGLNLNLLFTSEADFSGITGQKGIPLAQALHKTSIRVDEKGADVLVGMKTGRAATDKTPYEVKADRPFIFMIWDQKTDSILFMGRLSLP